MIKQLVDLQRNSKATCAVIPTMEYRALCPAVVMKANVTDSFLFGGDKPPFAAKLEVKSRLAEICYFIIAEIDNLSIEAQNRYLGLVKDRELNGYTLPNNAIIVFTVKDKKSLTKMSPELYHFAVVAF